MMMMRTALMTISYSIAFSILFSTGGRRGRVLAVAVANDNNCFGKKMVTTQLNFLDSTVTENELHEGNGGVIRYENIGYVNDRPIDFVVKVVKGTTYTSTKASIRNGKSAEGGFGQINVEELLDNKGSNGEGNFEFCLYDHENRNELVTAESFRFSMYDVDERNAAADGIKEKITMDTKQIEDFILYPNAEESEIVVSCEDGSEDGSTTSLPCDAGVRTIFHSTTKGTGGDNPKDPNNLDELQKKRSIVYSFKDTSCFTMTLSHYCPVDLCTWYGGGNFLFSGDADQLIEEGECITAPAQEEEPEDEGEEGSEEEGRGECENGFDNGDEYRYKDKKDKDCDGWAAKSLEKRCQLIDEINEGKPVSYYCPLQCLPKCMFMTSNEDASNEEEALTEESKAAPEVDCLGEIIESSSVTSLDFSNSVVKTNTLHLEGGELRYEDIGIVRDRPVSLVVTVASGDYTDIADVWAKRGKKVDDKNGKNGNFANINLQTVEGKPKSGEGNFKFCFHDMETDEVVTVDRFSFTVFDADMRKGGIEERMFMDTAQAQSFQLWPNAEKSEIKVKCEDGSPVPCGAGVRTIFASSTIGNGGDNPTDPDNMTDLQKSRSIAFQFIDTDCFEFTYDHFCVSEQIDEGGDGTFCEGYTGGNFLFGGSAEKIITDGECVLPTPPIEDTIAAVITEPLAPSICPGDVKLIRQQGITRFPEDAAVKIISQDISTVTVKLEQAWTSSAIIDSIYYEYKTDLFDSKCYEEVGVDRGVTYATITIQCTVLTPTAYLHICVADDITKDFLQVMDDAIIPKCCHSTTPEDSPVVCYNLQINCETECVEEKSTTSRRNLLRGNGQSSVPNE